MLARLDSRILRSSCDSTSTLSTMPVSRSSPRAPPSDSLRFEVMSRMSTSMSRASRVIWSKETGAVALERRAFRRAADPPTGPGMSSTYLSPSMPRLWIEADAPSRSATSRVSSRSTRALPPTRRMRATLPTRTPAIRTSDFSLSPATSSNWTEIVLPAPRPNRRSSIFQIEQSRQNENDEKERADLRRIAHRASEMARCLALSDSTVSGPSARPSTNWRTAGSLDFMNSSGGASKRILPPKSRASRSPILRALGM